VCNPITLGPPTAHQERPNQKQIPANISSMETGTRHLRRPCSSGHPALDNTNLRPRRHRRRSFFDNGIRSSREMSLRQTKRGLVLLQREGFPPDRGFRTSAARGEGWSFFLSTDRDQVPAEVRKLNERGQNEGRVRYPLRRYRDEDGEGGEGVDWLRLSYLFRQFKVRSKVMYFRQNGIVSLDIVLLEWIPAPTSCAFVVGARVVTDRMSPECEMDQIPCTATHHLLYVTLGIMFTPSNLRGGERVHKIQIIRIPSMNQFSFPFYTVQFDIISVTSLRFISSPPPPPPPHTPCQLTLPQTHHR
jgi:hypothetical protein